MNHTFLHLSDLHYRPNWHEESELVWAAFRKDLLTQIQQYQNPYLIFSGDLVHGGGDASLYSAFADRVVKDLRHAAIPKERTICVPGNHDVSQEALKPDLMIQMGALDQMKEESQFNGNVAHLSRLMFDSHFANYKAAEESFAAFSCCGTVLSGAGWELNENVGVFCLNTALCSYASSKDSNSAVISDKERLMIDTRTMHRWLAETSATTKILVMHHPIDWLAAWAKSELDRTIAKEFQLVFSGHVHEAQARYSSLGSGGSVHIVAPPLFTRKSDPLGYSFVTLDSETGVVEVHYRQWAAPARTFVVGTLLAGNDRGILSFRPHPPGIVVEPEVVIEPARGDTLSILQAEFDFAATAYSSRPHLWVERDLATVPEVDANSDDATLSTPQSIIDNLRNMIIRAPKEYGLTSLGRFIAYEHWRQHATAGLVVAMVDAVEIPAHRQGVIQHLRDRADVLGVADTSFAAIVVDNYTSDKNCRRILREIKAAFPFVPVILLQGVDDCARIADAMEVDEAADFEPCYLWALTKSRIRELVVSYVEGLDHLDDDLVTAKVTADLDALNIHRTPLNCLLILKLAEHAFEDSPVNRTEMIGRVLTLLFFQFDQIPRYATRPDLKDCEYALGYFCEWLFRASRTSFSKREFYQKTQEYCTTQLLDLDTEILFAFLVTEKLFVRKGADFEFRFHYWLHYFAAHRMHHDPAFADFILSDGRYSAYPELIEFYAGIDRRRSDAVGRITVDLKRMNAEFIERTNIDPALNPFEHFMWTPDDDHLTMLHKEVASGVAESSLPDAVKDAAADQGYDRARPYHQELAQFIERSSLQQLMQGSKGAARALRNSDHVTPEIKSGLLEEVLSAWVRVCQILVILSPVLASQKQAAFEDIAFVLTKGFNEESPQDRWAHVMDVIVDNVVSWFQHDLFSKKMGALFANHLKAHKGDLTELLLVLVMIRQRPPGWEKEVEKIVVREHKNSFYLHKVFDALRVESRIGFFNERTRQELRRLAAMTIAKHELGVKRPNVALIRKAAKAIDAQDAKKTNPTKPAEPERACGNIIWTGRRVLPNPVSQRGQQSVSDLWMTPTYGPIGFG